MDIPHVGVWDVVCDLSPPDMVAVRGKHVYNQDDDMRIFIISDRRGSIILEIA